MRTANVVVAVLLMVLAPGCDATTADTAATGDDTGATGTEGRATPDAGADADETDEPGGESGALDTPVDSVRRRDRGPAPIIDVAPPDNWLVDQTRVPFNVHLTHQHDPGTSLTFAWATLDVDPDAYVPRVWLVPADLAMVDGEVGPMPFSDDFVHEGTGLVYRETLFGIELSEEDFVKWTVEVTGLEPDTDYLYRIGTWEDFDAEAGTFSDPSLTSATPVRSGRVKGSREPFSFILAGDSRGGNDAIMAHMDVMTAMPADMWFFNGDMSNGGTQVEWNDWFSAMSPIMVHKPMMTVQGNHEILADIYYAQVAHPIHPSLPPDLIEHAWSFTYGNVHFVGLDGNNDDPVERTVPWLAVDLANAREDPDVDFIIAMMHHAPYSASNHGSTLRLQEHFSPLFDDYGVDLVFSGHDHNYERTHPIKGGSVVTAEEGVTYVVAGAFFSPAYSNGNEWWTATSTHGDKACFVHVEADGEVLEMTAYSGDGTEILDQLTVNKRPPQ